MLTYGSTLSNVFGNGKSAVLPSELPRIVNDPGAFTSQERRRNAVPSRSRATTRPALLISTPTPKVRSAVVTDRREARAGGHGKGRTDEQMQPPGQGDGACNEERVVAALQTGTQAEQSGGQHTAGGLRVIAGDARDAVRAAGVEGAGVRD